MFGGAGNDQLFGDADDVATADQGNDYLDGGDGDDYLRGYGGKDRLFGGAGADELLGEGGDDYLEGGEGNDILDAEEGNDVLLGGAGTDQLNAGDGDDVLDGGSGSDGLYGGDGDDVLVGGAGTDYLAGGDGNDTYLFSPGDSPLASGFVDFVDDRSGDNTVSFAGVDAAQIKAYRDPNGELLIRYGASDVVAIAGAFAGAVNTYRFDNGVALNWTQFVWRYLAEPAQLSSSEPGASLAGGASNDTLIGEGGGTTFYGGRGDDFLEGAGGGNTYHYDLGDGNDAIYNRDAQSNAAGSLAPNRIVFGAGIDPAHARLKVTRGSLVLDLGDELGSSIRLGTYDPDDVLGVRGIDLLHYADGTSITYEQLLARGLSFAASEADDAISGTNLADQIGAGAGDDRLSGGAGDDILIGGAGSDSLHGDDGADALDGGADNDVLQGGAGDDDLNGGPGDDLLMGGAGNDRYHFQPGGGHDRIVNRQGGHNTIVLDPSIALAELSLVRNNFDLELRSAGADSRMTIRDFFADTSGWQLATANAETVDLRERFRSSTDTDTATLEARIARDRDAFEQRLRGKYLDYFSGPPYATSPDGIVTWQMQAREYEYRSDKEIQATTHHTRSLRTAWVHALGGAFDDSAWIGDGPRILLSQSAGTQTRLIPVTHVSPPEPVFIPMAADAPESPLGSPEVHLVPGTQDGHSGYWWYPPGIGKVTYDRVPTVFNVTTRIYQASTETIIRGLIADDTNDRLSALHAELIDAGGGADVVEGASHVLSEIPPYGTNGHTYAMERARGLGGYGFYWPTSPDTSNHAGAYVFGGAGDDRLSGGEGSDFIAGGTGSNVLDGAGGADIYKVLLGGRAGR